MNFCCSRCATLDGSGDIRDQPRAVASMTELLYADWQQSK